MAAGRIEWARRLVELWNTGDFDTRQENRFELIGIDDGAERPNRMAAYFDPARAREAAVAGAG